MKKEKFLTKSLRSIPVGEKLAEIMAAAIDAVNPYDVVKTYLLDNLKDINRQHYERIFVVGAGKAGYPMARAAADLLGDRICDSCVTVKDGHLDSVPLTAPVRIFEARHPIPDFRSVRCTQLVLSVAQNAGEDDLVVGLISGGGSALLTAPANLIDLIDLQKTTALLLKSGADVGEVNTIRKHISNVKGGRLAEAAAPASMLTLILSDVVGDPVDMIASGPTAPDPTTYADACAVLEKYNLVNEVPRAVRERLRKGVEGIVPETPDGEEAFFKRVQNVIVGNNRTAAEAALSKAKHFGFQTKLVTDRMQGEARVVAKLAADEFEHQTDQSTLMIMGGETTVTVQGDGKGGRNQEFCLAAVPLLAGKQNVALISLATDGGDGPTDAAGAVVTGDTLARAEKLGLDWDEYLQNHDAYNFFEPLGDLLITGPTNTNVCDLVFIVWW